MITRVRMLVGMMVLGLVASLAPSALAADAKLTGTWSWTRKFQDNDVKMTLKLKQDGEKLSGDLESPMGKTEIADGKVDKDGNATWTVTRERDGNKFTIKYKGKVEGDVLKLQATMERDGETRTFDSEAKREGEKS
jgi:hypothetical protein